MPKIPAMSAGSKPPLVRSRASAWARRSGDSASFSLLVFLLTLRAADFSLSPIVSCVCNPGPRFCTLHAAFAPAPFGLRILRGGEGDLPLWSLPTKRYFGGNDIHNNDEQVLSSMQREEAFDKWSRQVAARGTVNGDGIVLQNTRREGPEAPVLGTPSPTREQDAGWADRHRHLEAARQHWWNGDTEAADNAFLCALSWHRVPTNTSEALRTAASKAAQGSNDTHSHVGAHAVTHYVTNDGALRWQHVKPLSNHGHTLEEADAMCEYAAFLYEATAEKAAAGTACTC